MHIFLILAALFIFVPILEIAILIQTGRHFGLGTTIAIVLITGFVGAALARHQGLQAWENVRRVARSGKVPSKELFDGVCILCAGLLMITPGLLTDFTGFLLLFPPFRNLLRTYLSRRMGRNVIVSHPGGAFSTGATRTDSFSDSKPPNSDTGEVIDVEAERLDD